MSNEAQHAYATASSCSSVYASLLFASAASAFPSSSSESSSSSPKRSEFIASIFLIKPSRSSTAAPGLRSELRLVLVDKESGLLPLDGRVKVGDATAGAAVCAEERDEAERDETERTNVGRELELVRGRGLAAEEGGGEGVERSLVREMDTGTAEAEKVDPVGEGEARFARLVSSLSGGGR